MRDIPREMAAFMAAGERDEDETELPPGSIGEDGPDFGSELDELGDDADPLDDAADESEPGELTDVLEEKDGAVGAEEAEDLDVGMSVDDLGDEDGDDAEGDPKDFVDDDFAAEGTGGERDAGEEGFAAEVTELDGELPPLDGSDDGVIEDSEVTSDDDAAMFDQVELGWDDRAWVRVSGLPPSTDAPPIEAPKSLPGVVLASARRGARVAHVVRGHGVYVLAGDQPAVRIPGTAGTTAVAWLEGGTLALARLRPSDDGSVVFLLREDGTEGRIVAEVGAEDEPGVTSLFWDGDVLWATGDFGAVGLAPKA